MSDFTYTVLASLLSILLLALVALRMWRRRRDAWAVRFSNAANKYFQRRNEGRG